ncbi:hypothetical protein ACFCX0_41430 [Streptomyces sp. NPDC056352]|uniref:hypothetical protein n=1 Tax=Streptomyces sp. NPDC056352 TaxID=3345791 RepID=UPI0035DBD25A
MVFTMPVIRWMLHRRYHSSQQAFMTAMGWTSEQLISACVLLPPPLPSLEPTPSDGTRTWEPTPWYDVPSMRRSPPSRAASSQPFSGELQPESKI